MPTGAIAHHMRAKPFMVQMIRQVIRKSSDKSSAIGVGAGSGRISPIDDIR
jgi:hypothetical protein